MDALETVDWDGVGGDAGSLRGAVAGSADGASEAAETASDASLPDAYSRAVISVAEAVGPAVVSLRTGGHEVGHGPEAAGAAHGPSVERLDVAADDAPVTSVDDLHRYLSEWRAGTPVQLRVVRSGESMRLAVVPEAD